MYELKAGTERIVYALKQRKEDPATLKQLAKILNYDPEQLHQDLNALSDFHALNELWSNNACIGYAIAGAAACGMDRKQQDRLIDGMNAAFDNMTLEEAEEMSMDS